MRSTPLAAQNRQFLWTKATGMLDLWNLISAAKEITEADFNGPSDTTGEYTPNVTDINDRGQIAGVTRTTRTPFVLTRN